MTSHVFDEKRQQVSESYFGAHLLDAVDRYLGLLAHLGVNGPVVLMATLLNVGGYSMFTERRRYVVRTIDREHLIIDDVLIESLSNNRKTIVRPILDAIWRATGFPSCYLLDDPDWPKSILG